MFDNAMPVYNSIALLEHLATVALGNAITLVADVHNTYYVKDESAPEIIARINRQSAERAAIVPTREITLDR